MHICSESERKKNHNNKDLEKDIERSDLLPDGVDNLLSGDHVDTADCTIIKGALCSFGDDKDLHWLIV